MNNSINVAVNDVYTTAVQQSAYNFAKPYQWLQGPDNVRIGSWGCCPDRNLVDNKFTLEITKCPTTDGELFRSLENFASSNNTNKWYIMPLVIIFILLSLLAFCNLYPKLCKRNKFFKFFILKKC